MRKSAHNALRICIFISLCQVVAAQDAARRPLGDTPDSYLIVRLVKQAYDATSGTNPIATRTGAIDAIGELGKGSVDAVPQLEKLLSGDNVKDAERGIYFQHVLQTAEKIGWPARLLLPEILALSSRDVALRPYVDQAVAAILKANPANKAPESATKPAAPATTPAPCGLTLEDVNKQLLETNKALGEAATSLDKLSKKLDAQVNPKPAEK